MCLPLILSLLKEILHCCLPNSLGLGLHQISHFLVACMNKNVLLTWPRFFYTWNVLFSISHYCKSKVGLSLKIERPCMLYVP